MWGALVCHELEKLLKYILNTNTILHEVGLLVKD